MLKAATAAWSTNPWSEADSSGTRWRFASEMEVILDLLASGDSGDAEGDSDGRSGVVLSVEVDLPRADQMLASYSDGDTSSSDSALRDSTLAGVENRPRVGDVEARAGRTRSGTGNSTSVEGMIVGEKAATGDTEPTRVSSSSAATD